MKLKPLYVKFNYRCEQWIEETLIVCRNEPNWFEFFILNRTPKVLEFIGTGDRWKYLDESLNSLLGIKPAWVKKLYAFESSEYSKFRKAKIQKDVGEAIVRVFEQFKAEKARREQLSDETNLIGHA
jgi:hypothetical protein